MELKQQMVIEIIKQENDQEYRFLFLMPHGCKIGMCYDAAYDCLSKITEIANEAHKKAEGKKNDAPQSTSIQEQ